MYQRKKQKSPGKSTTTKSTTREANAQTYFALQKKKQELSVAYKSKQMAGATDLVFAHDMDRSEGLV